MKNGQIELNFQNDTITFLEDEIPLNTTSNGLYVIRITANKQLLEKTDFQSPPSPHIIENDRRKVKQRNSHETPPVVCTSLH